MGIPKWFLTRDVAYNTEISRNNIFRFLLQIRNAEHERKLLASAGKIWQHVSLFPAIIFVVPTFDKNRPLFRRTLWQAFRDCSPWV
jgi:hypothetical protein